jgi:hypothetical protein
MPSAAAPPDGQALMMIPAGRPPAVVTLPNGHIGAILAMPELRQRISGLGMEPMHDTPQQMGAPLRQDIATSARVIESAGIEKQQAKGAPTTPGSTSPKTPALPW